MPVHDLPAETLLQYRETLAAISLRHLSPETRRKLAADELSVNAYPHPHGGLVYVGSPAYSIPSEPDLAAIFTLADRARIAWLMFDQEAGIVDGLPIFGNDTEAGT